LRGESHVMSELATRLLCVEPNNLVERPWGGDWIKAFKGVASEDTQALPVRWGEAFEISAFDLDNEAARFPSSLRFDDDSRVNLPTLLEAQGKALLGEAFVGRHGACFPLLPKTLDVKELLSVQGHPAGHTEVYVIIEAEPGATLRLGFNRDIDADELSSTLVRGIERQGEFLGLLGAESNATDVQLMVAPWFADRAVDVAALSHWLEKTASNRADHAAALLVELKALYWQVLDSMNEIEVRPGQVIYNATPERLVSDSGRAASAEVHALGNPAGLEILALEIRRPGPTFRAWDNVRFPQRDVDAAAAIGALNLCATRPEEFIAQRQPIPDRDGASVSVDCEYFRVEHLMPDSARAIDVPASEPHSLHCLVGAIEVSANDGRVIGSLKRGESALVPAGVCAYRVRAESPAEVVRVSLPEN